MLWFKAWLETRWRFGFVVGSILLVWVAPFWLPLFGLRVPAGFPASKLWVAIHLGTVLLYIYAAIFLAGSGINTQTTYSATSGFHPSMLFTLSLPVSRRRLLLVRAGLGALQTSFLVAIMAGYTLFERPGTTPVLQFLAYVSLSARWVCMLFPCYWPVCSTRCGSSMGAVYVALRYSCCNPDLLWSRGSALFAA
jgi:hypothetical protein